MRKLVKYLWLALSGVAALLVAVVLVFALTFDANRYKDDIERIAKERTGRTLKLQGELKLAVFPSLGASIAGVTLSEGGRGREFGRLPPARIADSIGVDFTARLDESSIRGKLAMARTAQPSYRFDLDIDRLDLDRYLAAGENKPVAAVDLSGLKGLNAQGQLQIGALQVQGLKLSKLKAQLKAAGGRAEISPHSASLYGGELSGALSLDGNANRIALKETFSNVSIGPLLRDLAHQDRLEGKGNVALDVAAARATAGAMKRSLSGAAKVRLRDGAIKGIDIAELLRKARAAAGRQSGQAADSKESTDFSELSASFSIKDGVAHNEDLDVKSPLLRIGGSGDIDIGRSAINYVVKASVVGTTSLTVPVKLAGPLDAMKYEVDYRAVAGDLAKSKVGDKVRDRLKGLLGR